MIFNINQFPFAMNKTLYTILGAFFGSFCAMSLFMSMMFSAWWLVDFIALS